MSEQPDTLHPLVAAATAHSRFLRRQLDSRPWLAARLAASVDAPLDATALRDFLRAEHVDDSTLKPALRTTVTKHHGVLTPGALVDNKYRLAERIGRGRKAAEKRLRGRLAIDEAADLVAMFAREQRRYRPRIIGGVPERGNAGAVVVDADEQGMALQ